MAFAKVVVLDETGKIPVAELPEGQGGLTLAEVKADTDIADAISKKHSNSQDHSNSLDHANTLDHSNSLDHTQGSDADLDATFEAALKNTDNHTSGTTNKVYTATEQTKLAGIAAGAQVNNISDTNATDLTDGGATTLHSHAGGSAAFPVGAVFMAVVDTNPNTLLGYGTWSQIANGQFLVGQKSTDTDFDVAEETGGAKTSTPNAHVGVAVDAHAAHTHAFGTLAAASVAASVKIGTSATSAVAAHGHTITGATDNPSASLTHTVTQPSAHAAMSIVPPYFVVYMWKRVS